MKSLIRLADRCPAVVFAAEGDADPAVPHRGERERPNGLRVAVCAGHRLRGDDGGPALPRPAAKALAAYRRGDGGDHRPEVAEGDRLEADEIDVFTLTDESGTIHFSPHGQARLEWPMLAFPQAVRVRLQQVWRPGAAFALPLVALGSQELLWPVIRPLAFLLLFPAVFASAYIGGLTVGLMSVGVTAVLGYLAFIDPRYTLLKGDSSGLLQTFVFGTVGVFVAVMLHRLDAANRRMAAALRAADRAEDNERVARDLHDAVLHRLFATGVLLSTAESLEHPDDLRAVLNDARGDLQDVTGTIRNAIFDLRHGGHLDGVQRTISDMVDDAAARLNCSGHAVFHGPVNAVVGDQAAEALLAVTQEALTNIARHAHATQFTVTVDVTKNGLTLTVTDNGVGIPTPVLRGSGLRAMATRAEQLGGICLFEPGPHSAGTTIRWSAYRDIANQNTTSPTTMVDTG